MTCEIHILAKFNNPQQVLLRWYNLIRPLSNPPTCPGSGGGGGWGFQLTSALERLVQFYSVSCTLYNFVRPKDNLDTKTADEKLSTNERCDGGTQRFVSVK